MTRNVGRIDQGIRIVVGLVLLAIVFVGPRTPFGWLGLIPLFTGLFGVCPVYALLGISTCERPTDRTAHV